MDKTISKQQQSKFVNTFVKHKPMMRIEFLQYLTPDDIFKMASLCRIMKEAIDPNARLISTDDSMNITYLQEGITEDNIKLESHFNLLSSILFPDYNLAQNSKENR